MTQELIKTDNYLLAVNDAEINVGDWFYDDARQVRKAIMGDELYWAVRNGYKRIFAHLPLNDAPILEGVPLLPPYSRHQEHGIEELVKEHFELNKELNNPSSFKAGYNKAKEKLDEVLKWIDEEILLNPYYKDSPRLKEGASMVKVKIKSLLQPKTPTHFDFWMGTRYHEDGSSETEILKVDNKHGQVVVCGNYI